MTDIDNLLATASRRAMESDLSYFGALTPSEAYQLLHGLLRARLVDVRTQAELDWVGRIPGSLPIEWNTYPGGQRNGGFIGQLRQAVPDLDTPLLFICRSGARSDAAARAATEAGYQTCFNVLEGFEGDKDSDGHRGRVGGWRKAGLPWTQS